MKLKQSILLSSALMLVIGFIPKVNAMERIVGTQDSSLQSDFWLYSTNSHPSTINGTTRYSMSNGQEISPYRAYQVTNQSIRRTPEDLKSQMRDAISSPQYKQFLDFIRHISNKTIETLCKRYDLHPRFKRCSIRERIVITSLSKTLEIPLRLHDLITPSHMALWVCDNWVKILPVIRNNTYGFASLDVTPNPLPSIHSITEEPNLKQRLEDMYVLHDIFGIDLDIDPENYPLSFDDEQQPDTAATADSNE